MIRTRFASLILVLVAGSACTNLFENFSNTTSDQALLDAAQIYNDQHDYNNALLQFPLMSLSYQTRSDVIALWASAFAGRGGLDFFALANAVQNMAAGTDLFLFLMQNFENGSAAKLADLLAAQNKLLTITTNPTLMTNDELMELAVISLANMGTILSKYEDPTDTGTPIGNVCTTAFPAFNGVLTIPGGDVAQFGVSLNWLMSTITQLSTNGISFGPATITGASADCTLLAGQAPPLPSYAFCNVTDPTTITNNQYKGILSLINEGSAHIGLGTCGGTIVACACP